jgi:hypothetical protein
MAMSHSTGQLRGTSEPVKEAERVRKKCRCLYNFFVGKHRQGRICRLRIGKFK